MDTPPSAIGRLLRELSWEGNARHYRQGGRGRENVLTTEVFQALDFLPRSSFLGRVLRSIEGGAEQTIERLVTEAEQARFSLLPGDIHLRYKPPSDEEADVPVQPDGILETPSVFCLLEAKRVRPSSFQPEQLAREFLAALQEAGERAPFLLLVLPEPPPVAVSRHGRMTLQQAVSRWLPAVGRRASIPTTAVQDALTLIDHSVGFTTWERLAKAVETGIGDFKNEPPTVRASVTRIAHSLSEAISWHS